MVFGESPISHRRLRQTRTWFLSGSPVNEVDTVTHLGIILSVSGSTLPHVLRNISSARSAFYALHSVNPHGGCLHPSTSLKLFKSFPLSILQFGLGVLSLPKTHMLMLERCQVGILRYILSLPSRTSTIAVHYLLGTLLSTVL